MKVTKEQLEVVGVRSKRHALAIRVGSLRGSRHLDSTVMSFALACDVRKTLH